MSNNSPLWSQLNVQDVQCPFLLIELARLTSVVTNNLFELARTSKFSVLRIDLYDQQQQARAPFSVAILPINGALPTCLCPWIYQQFPLARTAFNVLRVDL